MKFGFQAVVRGLCLCLLLQLFIPFAESSYTYADTGAWNVKVNFQPAASPVPEGFLPDSGMPFSTQNGFNYGWNSSHTDSTVSGSTYQTTPNDTAIRVHKGGVWEFEVNNGIYEVKVSVGESVYSSNNTVVVEGVSFFDRIPLEGGQHVIAAKSVEVADGRLTVSSGDAEEAETALQFIELTKVGSPSTLLALSAASTPVIGPPPEPRKVHGDKVLLSGKMNNEHNAPSYLQVDGLQEEIGRYMDVEVQRVNQLLSDFEQKAVACANCDPVSLQRAIDNSTQTPSFIKVGHLNLNSSVVFGSPSKPVVIIADGINTNTKLSIDVYGLLIVKGSMNANSELNLQVHSSSNATEPADGSLWVKGNWHLNNNSSISVDGLLSADSLTFNSGQLNVRAKRVLIQDQLHINTQADMNVEQEMMVGGIVSNNSTANIKVNNSDLFVRDDVHVNNQLHIQTGGLFAIGGNMTANQRPFIDTGVGGNGSTSLKYALHGLKAEYFSEGNFKGNTVTRVDPVIDLQNSPEFPVAGFNDQDISVRWSGQIEALFSEMYQFELQTSGPIKLWVNNNLLINKEDASFQGTVTGSVYLAAGQRENIKVEYLSANRNPRAALYWSSNSQQKERVPQSQLFPFGIPVVSQIPTETSHTLTWNPIFNADGYEVEADGVIYPIGPASTFVHENLGVGTLHTYRVRATSGDITGEWSSLASVWTLPAIPENLRLNSTSHTLKVEWDPVAGATGYDIEFSGNVVDNGSATTYLDNELNPNTQRSYRVRAKNSSGPGQWSSVVAKSTLPGVPSEITAIATDSSVQVTWNRIAGAESYDIEVDGALVVDTNHAISYLHGNLQPYTTHHYRVRAKNVEGAGPWSSEIEATTLPRTPVLTTDLSSANAIQISWSGIDEAGEYELEVDGAIIKVGTTRTFIHTPLEPNSEHTYRIRSKNVKAAGLWSAQAIRKMPPMKPQNVRFTAASDKIEVTWDPALGATSYDLEVDGNVVDVGLITLYTHEGVASNSQHTYRVRAKNQGGASEWSEAVMQSALLGQPQNFTAHATTSSIILGWDAVSGAESYQVLVDGVIRDNGSALTFTHDGLTPYSWHGYRVRAIAGGIPGVWSETLSKATLLGVPGNIRLSSTSSTITVSWDSVEGAAGYEVEADGQMLDNGMYTTFVHRNLSPDTLHTYRIRSKNDDGVSEWSERSQWTEAVIQITTPSVPANFKAKAAVDSVTLTWDAVSGARSYSLEVDGRVIDNITETSYKHTGLEPNTMHRYRIQAANGSKHSEWSEKLEAKTISELIVNVGKDNIFNLVVIAPKKDGVTARRIVVTYSPDDVEVQDLSAITPELELKAGPISGTNFTVSKFVPGEIVFNVQNADKTTINSIKFIAKTNEDSKVTYIVE